MVVLPETTVPKKCCSGAAHPGYWEGSYFAGGEGNLRTPCIVRWPQHVQAGGVSNDIMHVTDWFTTLLRAAGVDQPTDRVIDGKNQLDWLTGQQDSSARDGYIYWMGTEIYGVKWSNFKLKLVEQKYSTDPVGKLSSPRIINLIADPQEREPLNLPYVHSWTVAYFNQLLAEFQTSVQREPPIPAGHRRASSPQKHGTGRRHPHEQSAAALGTDRAATGPSAR